MLKAIRATKDVAVLMLTARDRVEDRVRGLQGRRRRLLRVKLLRVLERAAGALTALRRRGVRSGGTSEPTTLTFSATWQLDLARRKASARWPALELTNKEFLILGAADAAPRRGAAVAHRDRRAGVDMNFDSDTNVVEVAVRRLRAKLDELFETLMLRTVRGMGYMLESAKAPRAGALRVDLGAPRC